MGFLSTGQQSLSSLGTVSSPRTWSSPRVRVAGAGSRVLGRVAARVARQRDRRRHRRVHRLELGTVVPICNMRELVRNLLKGTSCFGFAVQEKVSVEPTTSIMIARFRVKILRSFSARCSFQVLPAGDWQQCGLTDLSDSQSQSRTVCKICKFCTICNNPNPRLCA